MGYSIRGRRKTRRENKISEKIILGNRSIQPFIDSFSTGEISLASVASFISVPNHKRKANVKNLSVLTSSSDFSPVKNESSSGVFLVNYNGVVTTSDDDKKTGRPSVQ